MMELVLGGMTNARGGGDGVVFDGVAMSLLGVDFLLGVANHTSSGLPSAGVALF